MKHATPTKYGFFTISSLFNVKLPVGDLKEKDEPPGDVRLVSAGKFNNGVAKLIKATQASVLFEGGALTVDMFGKAFYQDKPFYCVAHGRVNVLTPKVPLNLYSGLYLATAIDRCLQGKYSFSKMCSNGKLAKELICLPEGPEGVVDLLFMANYVRSLPYADLLPKEQNVAVNVEEESATV